MRELLSVRPSSLVMLVPLQAELPVVADVGDHAEVPGVVRAKLLQAGLVLGMRSPTCV